MGITKKAVSNVKSKLYVCELTRLAFKMTNFAYQNGTELVCHSERTVKTSLILMFCFIISRGFIKKLASLILIWPIAKFQLQK